MTAITLNSYEHVNSDHKNLKFNQLRDLRGVSDKIEGVLKMEAKIFKGEDYSKSHTILIDCRGLKDKVSKMVQGQIDRVHIIETSRRATRLHFNILLETSASIRASNNLVMQFNEY